MEILDEALQKIRALTHLQLLDLQEILKTQTRRKFTECARKKRGEVPPLGGARRSHEKLLAMGEKKKQASNKGAAPTSAIKSSKQVNI